MAIQQIFAYWMKYYRLKKNLSQENLADLADLHRTYIGSIERSERNITLINADKIAKALSLNLVDLLQEDIKKHG